MAKDIEIKGFQKHSLVDWDGRISSVIFLPYCTFRCPWCYARDLVLESDKMPTILFDEVASYIEEYKEFIEGAVITGGEPTMHAQLPELCRRLHNLGVLVKLDTNGTNPMMLKNLIDEKFVDYVAMDIKAPLTEKDYNKLNGNCNLLDKIKESILIIMKSDIDYEFRTTLVPGMHDENSVEAIAKYIKRAKKYALQNFMVPPQKGKLIDPKFETVRSFTKDEMLKFKQIAEEYVKKVTVRGV
ncbi:MAG: anaerobic ribonucleoside-triphosphate reductase activating protein [Candidatus Micrarchaeia archaeon]